MIESRAVSPPPPWRRVTWLACAWRGQFFNSNPGVGRGEREPHKQCQDSDRPVMRCSDAASVKRCTQSRLGIGPQGCENRIAGVAPGHARNSIPFALPRYPAARQSRQVPPRCLRRGAENG